MGAGCQGELKLRSAVPTVVEDMAQVPDLVQPVEGVSFADINRDMDQTQVGCSAFDVGGCHGTATPKGILALKVGFTASKDDSIARANYAAVVPKEVDLAEPEKSQLLTRALMGSGVPHTGGTPFKSKDDPVYQRWLKWIQLGAKFEFVPYSNLNNGAADMAGGN